MAALRHPVVLRLQMGRVEVVREEDELGADEGYAVLLPGCEPGPRIGDEVEAVGT